MTDFWYAIITEDEDDWGMGSDSIFEAREMCLAARHEFPNAYIAVIESDDSCDWWSEKIDEIHEWEEI